jgi:hypothetical protein
VQLMSPLENKGSNAKQNAISDLSVTIKDLVTTAKDYPLNASELALCLTDQGLNY